KVTRFKREGKQYEVILQLTRVDRSTPSDLRNIYVRSTGGEMVSLANIVSIEEAVAPLELNHFDQLRAATITANLADGYSLGDALAFVDAVAAEVLPGTAQTDYAGQSREFRDSGAEIYLTFVLALIFIYLVP